jgi:hypothetical protein
MEAVVNKPRKYEMTYKVLDYVGLFKGELLEQRYIGEGLEYN